MLEFQRLSLNNGINETIVYPSLSTCVGTIVVSQGKNVRMKLEKIWYFDKTTFVSVRLNAAQMFSVCLL